MHNIKNTKPLKTEQIACICFGENVSKVIKTLSLINTFLCNYLVQNTCKKGIIRNGYQCLFENNAMYFYLTHILKFENCIVTTKCVQYNALDKVGTVNAEQSLLDDKRRKLVLTK